MMLLRTRTLPPPLRYMPAPPPTPAPPLAFSVMVTLLRLRLPVFEMPAPKPRIRGLNRLPLTVELEIVARPVLCNPPPNPVAIGTPGSWSVPLSCSTLRAMSRIPSLKIPPPSPSESRTKFSPISVWSMIAVPELLSPPPLLDTAEGMVPSAKFCFSVLRLSTSVAPTATEMPPPRATRLLVKVEFLTSARPLATNRPPPSTPALAC